MTREEKQKAIDALKISTPIMAMTPNKFDDYIKTLNKIADLLEQEPCEDAISRQAVLDMAEDMTDQFGNKHRVVTEGLISMLPPVTPKPKKGHWEQFGNSWEDKFKCSECGKEQPKILCGERIIGHWSDYCPNCGADMRESEE